MVAAHSNITSTHSIWDHKSEQIYLIRKCPKYDIKFRQVVKALVLQLWRV